MRWRDPHKQRPKSGEAVGIIYQHWKEHKYFSSQVMFGEVEVGNDGSIRVNSYDFTGAGSWSVYFDEYSEVPDYGTIRNDDVALAWIPANEFVFPEWVPHDRHWGDLK